VPRTGREVPDRPGGDEAVRAGNLVRARGENAEPTLGRLDQLRSTYLTVPTDPNPRPSELRKTSTTSRTELAQKYRRLTATTPVG
jgi:hypothetical protein